MSSSTLPPDWVSVQADDGDTYYWNQVTDETTWERPTMPVPAKQVPKKPPKPKKPPRTAKSTPTVSSSSSNTPPSIPAPTPTLQSRQPKSTPLISRPPISKPPPTPSISAPSSSAPSKAKATRRTSLEDMFGGKNTEFELRLPTKTYNEFESPHRCIELNVAFKGAVDLTGSTLLREGPLTKFNKDGTRTYQFLLFTDKLIYCNPSRINNSLTLHQNIPLDVALVQPSDEDPTILVFYSRVKSFPIQAKSMAERDEWVRDIDQTIRQYQSQCGVAGSRESSCAPLWVPNAEATECSVCRAEFTFLVRKHHCRNCGTVVCGNCSQDKVRVPKLDDRALYRVCLPCARALREQAMTKRGYGAPRLDYKGTK